MADTFPTRSRAWIGLVLALAACGAPSPPPAPVRHLLDGVPVTLGKETRLASGAETKLLLRADIAAGQALPRFARLPASLAEAGSLLLHYRLWQGGEGRDGALEHSVVAAVERRGDDAVVRLRGLGKLAPAPPLTIEVAAFALPGGPGERLRFEVDVPEGAALEFGYGLRQESWSEGSAPVRFRVWASEGGGEPEPLFDRRLDPSAPGDRRWFDARIELGERAGRPLTLELEAMPEGEGASPALPVFADPILSVRGAPSERPNLVLVSVDTLRARSLGSYGYARDTSPFLDSVARQGTLFENAITTSVTTAPSHMSLFTGLYPPHHGVLAGTEWKVPGTPTLAGILRAAGYRTAAFTENGFIIRRRGFGEGFGLYVENRNEKDAPRDARITFSQARRWLETSAQAPFLLFVHTYEVHTPYAPPPRYAKLFAGDRMEGPAGRRIRRLRDDYDREIRYVDDELRALFETLAKVGVADTTVVVVTSDHGEEFAEHGLLQHGSALFEESLRIPLIFWGPGRIPAGRRIEEPVSLIDVKPTLLALAEVPAPPDLDGVELVGAMRGGDGVPRRMLFAEARAPLRWTAPEIAVRWNPPLIALRGPDAKFLVHRPAAGPAEPSVAFDLATDPGEAKPRALEPAEESRVRGLVDSYMAGRTRARHEGATSPEALDPELEQQLRELGYLP